MTLVGMLLGMAFIRLAASWQPLIWAAFWALTALHVWANVRAMRCLRITGINQARAALLLRHYLCQVGWVARCLPAACHQVPILACPLASAVCLLPPACCQVPFLPVCLQHLRACLQHECCALSGTQSCQAGARTAVVQHSTVFHITMPLQLCRARR